MKLKKFDYSYPKGLVAQRPLNRRDASRMMIVNRQGLNWRHGQFADFPDFLKSGDILVFNDTRVITARLFGNIRKEKTIELLLVERIEGNAESGQKWRCLIKNMRVFAIGDTISFGRSKAVVAGRDGDFLVVLFPAGHCEKAMEHFGVPPLPPYIKRPNFESYTKEDRKRYQTIYASKLGSAAAPTAGLHFSDEILQKITATGIITAKITLHVGADTFAPVRTDDISNHKMHGEEFIISDETAKIVNDAKLKGGRIIAVGTSTVRALETSVVDGRCRAGKNRTNLFITPGYEFKIVDGLLTNFHQPQSTLLILVSAFAGLELILSAYEEAIGKKYRLFSYGDCMLII